jgi:hypothetical protein
MMASNKEQTVCVKYNIKMDLQEVGGSWGLDGVGSG